MYSRYKLLIKHTNKRSHNITILLTYYDTENVNIEEIIIKGSRAYTWEIGDMIYLI